jgi:selenide,water dikinase
MKEIVLIGGGHAHVHVLKAFAKRPLPNMRLTLVSRDAHTPYSGMLPGVIAGMYRPEEAHIDLRRLAEATNTKLVIAEANGLDRRQKRILLRDQAPLPYDIVSLDIGIAPDLRGILGAPEHALAVKPIGTFLAKLEKLLRLREARRFVMVGGGAGGMEVLLSLQNRLTQGGDSGSRFTLVTAGEILPSHNPRVRAAFRRLLATSNVILHEHSPVRRVTAAGVDLADGTLLSADNVLIATGANAPDWLQATDLALDGAGCIQVTQTLQSLTDVDVFAAGDCASFIETPREKAGVYAVRAGPPLAVNLQRHAMGEAPLRWQPQSRHLGLITAGRRYCVASRGDFMLEGAWLWWVKDWIDRRWLRQYQS